MSILNAAMRQHRVNSYSGERALGCYLRTRTVNPPTARGDHRSLCHANRYPEGEQLRKTIA